ncbi:ABC transporter ATP-binding protein [Micromonospora aurantiaca (nom. illeg.)]|uniref:ABC transporter ATP-binding protein n=1 Tax=Micromonospora aurantiaca (nom. illeg.) TaxID=47850 RepID=UPI0033F2869C
MTQALAIGARVARHVRHVVAARWRLATLLPAAGWPACVAAAACNAVLGVLPVIFVVATGSILAGLPAAGGPQRARVLGALVVAAAAFTALQVLVPVQAALGELVARRVDARVRDELITAALRPPGLERLEDQESLALLDRARGELDRAFQSPGRGSAGLLHLIARYTQLLGFAVVLGALYSWLAGAAVAAVVLLFRHGHRGGLHRYSNVFRANAHVRREGDYLRQLSIGPGAAKEIRVFGLAGWLVHRYRAHHLSWLLPTWRARRRIMLWPYFWYTGAGLLVTAAVLAGVGASAAQTAATAQAAVAIQAVMGAVRLGEYYPEADLQTEYGGDAYGAVREFVGRTEAQRGGPPVVPADRAEVPPPRHELRFEGVTFRYPGRPEPVFDGLDLSIAVGRCTAVVGLNGAGKTTLVKLLARLYEPDAGTISADGTDIRRYPVERWRALLAVVFQDFLRHETSANDNIGLGSVAHIADDAGIRSSAAAAGILDALHGLPDGFATPLAAHVEGGTDLSGGQWQRVALARALFRLRHDGAILVLDEPTASLDVRAEARFFAEFAQLTEGRTTVLISHRFSTVRRADHIVVLDGGRITEQGSHDELVARGGRYARLFRLQSDRFGEEPAAGHGQVATA